MNRNVDMGGYDGETEQIRQTVWLQEMNMEHGMEDLHPLNVMKIDHRRFFRYAICGQQEDFLLAPNVCSSEPHKFYRSFVFILTC